MSAQGLEVAKDIVSTNNICGPDENKYKLRIYHIKIYQEASKMEIPELGF